MTDPEIYCLMEDTNRLSNETLPALEQAIAEYPYFHTASMLYLKNLAELKDIRFSSELQKRSVSIPDRRKLFLLIEGGRYGMDIDLERKIEPAAADTFALIDNYLLSVAEKDGQSADGAFLFQPSVSSDYLYWSLAERGGENPGENDSIKLKHHDLIDDFIRHEEEKAAGVPFAPIEKDPADHYEVKLPEDPASIEDTGCFTETLARIYVKQKRYEKALQIIKNLSLKYPEKNVYFADQIRFLEKLIINTKK